LTIYEDSNILIAGHARFQRLCLILVWSWNMRMKKQLILTAILTVFLGGCVIIPTPDSAMGWRSNKDHREWTMQYGDRNKGGFIGEFVPKGDSIESWKEMVAHQIVFTTTTLRNYVDTWKDMLRKTDSQADIKEETLADGSILVTYTSFLADETSMRRFIKGQDGVYMLAYHVRPKWKKDDIFKIWEDIIRTANLIPNPEKR
jgi:hypothetical protein